MDKEGLFDRWFHRFTGAFSLWTAIPAGAVAVVSAVLANGVEWINTNLGAWGWFMAGLLTFVLTVAGLSLMEKAKLWRLNAAYRRRMEAKSSQFDPMEPKFEGKRILLADLVPPGGRVVADKRFINCQIVGPGTIVPMLQTPGAHASIHRKPTFEKVAYFQVDKPPVTAIEFWDCDFDGCHFLNLNMLFFERSFESEFWVTPLGAPTGASQTEGPESGKGTEPGVRPAIETDDTGRST